MQNMLLHCALPPHIAKEERMFEQQFSQRSDSKKKIHYCSASFIESFTYLISKADLATNHLDLG